MRRQVEWVCDRHPHRHDCPDCLIEYAPHLREYGLLVHDGGMSSLTIRFCPWCGARLPESLRDRWFEELAAHGIDPWQDDIPEPFRSSAWWSAGRAEPGVAPDRRPSS
jgi:hypothetical protein